MSLLVDNHPLSRDLPELKNAIHVLKQSDAHFSRGMESYETLDKEIVRVEQGLEYRTDAELDSMKLERVRLKDTLYARLRQEADKQEE